MASNPAPAGVHVGQIVNYVLDSQYNHPGEIRPAIVTQVWSGDLVNLDVRIDGENDYPVRRIGDGSGLLQAYWRTSVVHEAPKPGKPPTPGTWHELAAAGVGTGAEKKGK